jgi:hypothetical protein
MSNLRLSHSAQERYLMCGKEYYLHYVEKLRTIKTGSALIFGTAIDRACENYILEREPLRARGIFKQFMHRQEINGEETELAHTTKIEYLSSDFDSELLTESDNELLLKGTVFANVKEMHSFLKGKRDNPEEALTEEDSIRWNYLNWISLYRKGKLLVNAFMDFVDENVEEVYKTQPTIELADEDGDQVIGNADFIVKLKDHAYPVVLDLKTSSKYYDKNSVKESKQLALYTMYFREFYPGMKKAGFVVLNKNIKKNREKICKTCGHDSSGSNYKDCPNIVDGKRCKGEFTNVIYPEARVQFVLDTVPEEMIESVVEGFNLTKGLIKTGQFLENRGNCLRYGGKFKCAFYDLCHHGKMDGLISKKKEEENGTTKEASN